MRKRFSMGWLWVFLWALSACSTPAPPVEVIDDPALIYFEIIGHQTITLEQSLDDNLNAFELFQMRVAEEAIHLVYSESEFGIFIEELADIVPPSGAFIQISLNDVPLEVGLADATFSADDVFRFEMVFWDSDAALRYHAILDFLKTEVTPFLDQLSYEVYTALGVLDLLEFGPSLPLPLTEIDLIRSILILRSVNEDEGPTQTLLADQYTTDVIFRAGLGLIALKGSDYYPDAKAQFMESVDALRLDDTGFDDLAMTIIALAEDTPEPVIETFQLRLFENLNAPSLAHAIMALLVLNEDPYTYQDEAGMHVVDHLLALQHPSGGFLYDANSSEHDPRQFSSPQSFLALVILDQWMNGNPQRPYHP